MEGFRKFLILLYKGLLFRKRHYVVTAFEIVFPVLIASIPAIIQSEANIPNDISSEKPGWVNDTTHLPFNPFKTGPKFANKIVLFVYAPIHENTGMIMNDSVKLWESYQYDKVEKTAIEGLKEVDELEHYCMVKQRENGSLIVIGTLFNNFVSQNLPSNLDYTIRYSYPFSYSNGFATNLKYRFSEHYADAYSDETFFLSWQASVEKTFIKKKMAEKVIDFDYEISMQEFPFPGHKAKNRGFSLAVLIPLMFVYGFIVFVLNLTRRVIEEKSNGSKELLKMMGMTDFIYWLSTFMNYFIVGAVVFMIITIVYKSPLKNSTILLEHSNGLLLLIIFLLFVANLILFCLALTTFFNKPMFGTVFLIIAYNVCYSLLSSFVFVADSIELSYYSLPLIAKLCICLLPPGAILTVSEIILSFEASGEGIQWYNLYSFDAIPDLNLSLIMLTLLFSCFFYCVVIWYVDAVWPWQYGVPKPLYFPFTKSYWCGYQENKVEEFLLETDLPKSSDFFEDDPTGISPGVVINNLSKVFRNGLQTKIAVNNVSLNFYNGQITALLGHNGAGKTTTINILTGMYSPSSGTASIDGWDIFKQTSKARQSLGVCPQHNVLYDTLTVEEHLNLYAALKGVSWNKLNEETDSILNMLNLSDKKSEITKNLSGGMKRKLSLGIAVIGGSKVLFLDEPTSGMDVEARRSVWDALLDLRHNHTIVLTTHYMEEADVLGDRIAIMAEGEIQCCGSPLFLKKKFGTGYHLHVVKKENFNLDALQAVLSKHVPTATLENEFEGEATFNLMSSSSSNFGPLFEEIELSKDTLGVNSCGVTITTMEDVFLNVANIADLKVQKENFDLQNEEETEMKDVYIESSVFGKTQLFQNQFLGLFLKRLHYAKRYWSVLLSQLILPFVMLCICMFIISNTSINNSLNQPSLKLDVQEVYGATDGFYKADRESQSLAEDFDKVLHEKKVYVRSLDDPDEYILNYGRKSLADYFKRLIVGGSLEKSDNKLNVTAWFNGFPYHAQPMSLLLMDTAILRHVTKTGYITLTNNPLPHADIYYYEDSNYTKERILASVFVPLALSFLSASFVYVPIHERTSKAKLLQMMTGISSALYWFSMFVWDFIIHSIVSFLLIIPFAIFSHYAFFAPHSEAIGTAVLMFLLYGWCSIPFSYLFSLIFKKPNTGFNVVNGICVITGVALCSIYTSLMRIGDFKNDSTAKAFSYILRLFPSYALSSGFSNLFAIAFSNSYCESISPVDLKYNCDKKNVQSSILKCCKDICGDKCQVQIYPITWDEDACGRDIFFLLLDGIIFFALLLLLESSLVKSLIRTGVQRLSTFRKTAVTQFVDGNFMEDSEVLNEEERVRNNYEQLAHNDALVVLNLSKQFKNIKAVDRLTFGIHEKECFGLLGVNGAGKTTTFRMLTGDCYPSEGNAYIGKYSVTNDLKKFQSHIGYCPQFDALIDRLSAREMITLFARLRGLKGSNMTRYVNALIKMTDLTKHAEKPSMVYSGGNKRKLSIALALIGSPPLLLLDEPTAGVDPVSRRKIWKILSFARSYSGAAVILTTHSMEESEALCSRLAIMVNGRFRCLGSIQQLKSKFGQGYSVIIKMKKEEQSIPQSMNAVKAYIDTNLPGAYLKDDHQGMLQYHVVDPSVTLSRLFKFMDEMKKNCNLEDYVISDTSLEQIFLAFARSQRITTN